MTTYSGRTTDHGHKFDDWEDKGKNIGKDCIRRDVIVFDVQWSNCPIEVEEEVERLWSDYSLCNDHCYFNWDNNITGEFYDEYPVIAEYLKSHGVEKCLIYWWW